MDLAHKHLTERIIRAFYDVHDELGAGFVESVYENALAISLRDAGFEVQSQVPIRVRFRGRVAGIFRADLVVARIVVIEVKAVPVLLAAHQAQLLNYLRATDYEIGLLVNFSERLEFKRKIQSNNNVRAKSAPIRASPRQNAAREFSDVHQDPDRQSR